VADLRRILGRLPIVPGGGSPSVNIADDVAWTSNELRVVAMDLSSPGATPYVLEDSAALIWREIAATGRIRVDELTRRLSEQFDIEAARIQTDVETLLADLVARR